MDRVMVSWNVPNLITINLMAWLGFLAFILLFQSIAKRKNGSNSSAPTSSGADEVVSTGGY